MVMLSPFSTLRPSLLKVWLCSPLFLAAVGASAQVLAGQTYTITIPSNYGNDTYSVGLIGLNGSSPTLTNTPGTTTYVSSPLTAGQYSVIVDDFNRMGPDHATVSSLNVFPANGSAQSSLLGQYTFQLAGKTTVSGQNQPSMVAVAGNFTVDGKGNITAGVVDINSPAGILAGEPVTGTYQVNAFGVGTLSLVTSQFTLQLTLTSAPLTASASQNESASGTGYALPVSVPLVSGGAIATTAGGLAAASGTFFQVTVPASLFPVYQQLSQAPPATLNNSYFASLSGQSFGAPLTGAAHFQFTTNGTVTVDVTVAGNGSLVNFPGWTGTYTPFDSTTGRSVLTLTNPTQPEAPAQVFSAYESQSGGTLYLTSIAPGQVTGLLTGRADQ